MRGKASRRVRGVEIAESLEDIASILRHSCLSFRREVFSSSSFIVLLSRRLLCGFARHFTCHSNLSAGMRRREGEAITRRQRSVGARVSGGRRDIARCGASAESDKNK